MRKVFMGAGALFAVILLFVLSLPTIVHKAGMHPKYHGAKVDLPGKRALIITTSHGVLSAPGETDGDPTGVAASEMTHPYYAFSDGGMVVDIASIQGGKIPIDPSTLSDVIRSPEDERYLEDPIAKAKAENSIPLDDVDITEYDIVFLAGGWGAAYDLAPSPELAQKVTQAYYGYRSAIIGGVCHGPLGLVRAKDKNGDLLIEGRRMTGVTNKQVKELGIEMTPFHPEAELRKAGAMFESQTAFCGCTRDPCGG